MLLLRNAIVIGYMYIYIYINFAAHASSESSGQVLQDEFKQQKIKSSNQHHETRRTTESGSAVQ